MKRFLVLLLVLFVALNAFALNPDVNWVQPSLVDSNAMGRMLVQEWAFGSIDIAFIVLSIVTIVILLRYGIPVSMLLVSVMGYATVFALGFNSVIAWGVIIAGIVAISLMIVINLLLKTQY